MKDGEFIGMVSHINVPCVGCGKSFIVEFLLPKIVISAPQFACSHECLARWTVSMKSFLERQVTDAS